MSEKTTILSIRMPATLKERLQGEADSAGMRLSAYCELKLGGPPRVRKQGRKGGNPMLWQKKRAKSKGL